jgi:hypothetical protein
MSAKQTGKAESTGKSDQFWAAIPANSMLLS